MHNFIMANDKDNTIITVDDAKLKIAIGLGEIQTVVSYMPTTITNLNDYIFDNLVNLPAKRVILKQLILVSHSSLYLEYKVKYVICQQGVTNLTKRLQSRKRAEPNITLKQDSWMNTKASDYYI